MLIPKIIVMKKRLFAFILAIGLIAVMSYGQSSNSVSDLMLKSYSARTFTSEPVSAGDLEVILKCGIKAPSANNAQPWKFTVVRDLDLMQQMIGNVTQGNVLILISGMESRATVDYDCGLATENMAIAAISLGLGQRIYTGPIRNINLTMKEILQIPEGYRAVAVLRVGHIEKNVDAVSAASPRNSYEDVVTFLK
jgi:nitroreductase